MFPAELLPIVTVLSILVHFLLGLPILVAFLIYFDAPIERRPEREDPRIESLPDLLPGWACDYVMTLAEPALRRGMVVDETGGESIQDERSNRVMNFGLADSDVVLELINHRLAVAAGSAGHRVLASRGTCHRRR